MDLVWLSSLTLLLVLEVSSGGIGEAWSVVPYSPPETAALSSSYFPRSQSPFEIRTVTGYGHFPEPSYRSSLYKGPKTRIKNKTKTKSQLFDVNDLPEPEDALDVMTESSKYPFTSSPKITALQEPTVALLQTSDEINDVDKPSRLRRDVEENDKMEKLPISVTKNVREARQNSPESWSKQPLSVEFRHRAILDDVVQSGPPSTVRSYEAPRADFVTSNRRYFEGRESRDLPSPRSYDDEYDVPAAAIAPLYRTLRYDAPMHRGGYHYPDRYRMDREFYYRHPNEPPFSYDRYRDEELDLYGRSRPTPKPKRIIYYATLPEVVRKPVDLRNYVPRPYDPVGRTPEVATARDLTYKRVPGNVDPNRYRYRSGYDYDPYPKRSGYPPYDRPYAAYREGDRRKDQDSTLTRDVAEERGFKRKGFENQQRESNGNEDKIPWPVQIETEVTVKDKERIPGRKIFGDADNYDNRFRSGQLTKSSEASRLNDRDM